MDNKELSKRLDFIAGLISAGIHKRTVIKLNQRGHKIESETTAEQPTLEQAKHYCSEAYGKLILIIDELDKEDD